jgi:single-stranded-DNA-specific exonuclease
MVTETYKGCRYVWHHTAPDTEATYHIATTYNLSRPIAETLVKRGFSVETIRPFLFGTKEESVASGSLLKDANRAVDRIEQALARKEKMLIFGDYDVDGMTATAVALLALKPCGAQINFTLPHRCKDGYGLSPQIVKKAANAGFTLIITVDNGISSHNAAITAQERGIDLIITDHHQPAPTLPEAYAIVNPQQIDCSFPFKDLSGVGVIFKLMELLYQKRGMELPSHIYELVMLGTIADVVPLIEENRYWVRHGLTHLNKTMSFSFECLKNNCNIGTKRIGSQDVGFWLAPQLNAIGRLDDPREGVYFLTSTNHERVSSIAQKLKDFNEKRKQIEAEVSAAIEKKIAMSDGIDIHKDHVIVAASSEWPLGVIGLVAGKLTNRYGRPTLLFHLTPNGIAKGSCRSIPSINIFHALEAHKDILTSFGGHTVAAGVSLRHDKLDELKHRLNEHIAQQIPLEDLQPQLVIDATLDLHEANGQLMHDLEIMEPFGNKNPVPLFVINDVVLVRPPQLLKQLHVKCMIFSGGIVKPVIFFNRPDLYPLLQEQQDDPFSVVAQVTKNEWEGRTSIELQGVDVRFEAQT